MIPYILHISILVACSYIFYKLFLEGETFFQLNRWVLLACALLAFVLPFFEVPQEWSLRQANVTLIQTKIEKDKPATFSLDRFEKQAATKSSHNHLHKHNHGLAANHQNDIAKNDEVAPVVAKRSNINLSFSEILMYVYLAGVVIFSLNFLVQLILLFYKMLTLPTIRDGQFKIVEMDKDKAPFSFWNRIFMNPSKYDWTTYNQILQHEKIHVSERHTFDIILAELLVIVQWFNPFAWFYRKAVENNLEYLTDYKMLTKGTDRQSYQMNLLKIRVSDLPFNLTTNYNQSFLKKRISMMNTKKSSISSGWKYLFLFPILGLSIVCLNAVKTVAKEMEAQHNDHFEQVLNHDIEQSATSTITSPTISASEIEQSISESINLSLSGKWTGTIEGNKVCISFKNEKESKRDNWRRSECFDKEEFSNIPVGEAADFDLIREAGTLKLNGRFENNEGIGSYTFEENTALRTYLKGKGYDDISKEMMFHLALSDISKNYLSELNNMGLKMNNKDLKHLAHIGPSLDFIKKTNKALKSMGYSNVSLDNLMSLDIHDVNMEYIKELRSLGFKDMTIEDIVQASIHDVTPDYFRSLKGVGLDDLSMDEMIQFAIHDIQVEDVQALKNLGFRDMTAEDIVHAGIYDVTPEYLKSFEAVGLSNLSMEEITQFAIHDIKAEDVKELQNLGYRNMTADDIIHAGIHDVTPEYLKSFEAVGLSNLSMEEITQFAIHDIKAEDVKAMQNLGFRDMTADDIVHAGIHDVTPEYLKSFEAVGLSNLSMEEITQFAIHDVEAEDVKALQNLGYRDMDVEDIVHANIHDVTPEYLAELKAAGLGEMEMEEVVQFAIHDVEAEDIQELRNLGFKELNNEDIIHANIHDVDADFIRDIHELGFKDATMEQLVSCSIHDVDADFIKEVNASGKSGLTLEDYIALKIHGDYDHK